MSEQVETSLGFVRHVGADVWTLELPCGHVERLNDAQAYGRLSVDHAATGCASRYHETHDYARARLKVLMQSQTQKGPAETGPDSADTN